MSSVHTALAVSGHLDVNVVDHDRVRERPLCRGQIVVKMQGCHGQLTIVKAGGRLAKVTVKAVSTVLLLGFSLVDNG